jgi:hypothetical protein
MIAIILLALSPFALLLALGVAFAFSIDDEEGLS